VRLIALIFMPWDKRRDNYQYILAAIRGIRIYTLSTGRLHYHHCQTNDEEPYLALVPALSSILFFTDTSAIPTSNIETTRLRRRL
jgi:hypothetical protein